jgi:hypothetical protein
MTLNQTGFNPGSFLGPHYSFDLSAATDRFPMEFQKKVVSHLIGEELSGVWAQLLIGLPFRPIWKDGADVYYGAGQPMGAYTSWAVFALCHH